MRGHGGGTAFIDRLEKRVLGFSVVFLEAFLEAERSDLDLELAPVRPRVAWPGDRVGPLAFEPERKLPAHAMTAWAFSLA
jgi:hypothetical protein